MLQSLTTSLIGHTLGNKHLLTIFNILIPIAVYFEAGPVSAVTTYFGFFLVVSLAMHLKRASDREDMMNEVLKDTLGGALKDAIKKGKTQKFDTEDAEVHVTEVNFDDLPDEIRQMIDREENKDKDEDKNNHENETKH